MAPGAASRIASQIPPPSVHPRKQNRRKEKGGDNLAEDRRVSHRDRHRAGHEVTGVTFMSRCSAGTPELRAFVRRHRLHVVPLLGPGSDHLTHPRPQHVRSIALVAQRSSARARPCLSACARPPPKRRPCAADDVRLGLRQCRNALNSSRFHRAGAGASNGQGEHEPRVAGRREHVAKPRRAARPTLRVDCSLECPRNMFPRPYLPPPRCLRHYLPLYPR
jgi:hypothetical protein